MSDSHLLREKMALSYLAQLAGQMVSFVAGIFFARLVGPDVLGQLAFGMSYVAMWSFVADMGAATSHVKLVSEGKDLAACNGVYVRVKAGLTGVFLLFMVGMVVFQKHVLRSAALTHNITWIIVVCTAIFVLDSVSWIPRANFMAQTERAKLDLVMLGHQVLDRVARLGAAMLGLGVVTIAFAGLCVSGVVFPIHFALFRDRQVGRWDRTLAGEFMKIAAPLVAVTGLGTIGQNLDRQLLQYLAGAREVGYYAIVFGVSVFLQMIGTTVGGLYFPLFSRLIAEGRSADVVAHVREYVQVCNRLVAPALVVVIVGSGKLLPLVLGPKYLPSCGILSIVLGAVYLSVLTIPYGNVLAGAGKFWLGARLRLYYILILGFLEYVFVAPALLNMGGLGAACAFLAANLVLKTISQIAAERTLGLAMPEGGFLLGLLAWGGLNLAIYRQVWSVLPAYVFLGFIPVYLIITYGTMILAGVLQPGQVRVLLAPGILPELWRYARAELRGPKT